MSLDQVFETFIAESRELLDDMEASLLSLKPGLPADGDEAVNAVFRAAHTIKGSAGLFRLAHVVDFAHAVEGVLDGVRTGRIAITTNLVTLLLSCCDHMRALTETLAAGRLAPDASLQAAARPLMTALRYRAASHAPA